MRPDSGEILVDGVPVRPRDPQDAQAHGIALVDQELSLVPALSVADNIFLGGAAGRSSLAGAASMRQPGGCSSASGSRTSRLRLPSRRSAWASAS